MSGHTKGPWSIIDLEPKGYGDPQYVSKEIESADGRIVASVVFDSFDDYEVDANTSLIAAAPDLLEALELMASDYMRKDGLGFDLMASSMMFKAIAKARGEA